MKWRNATAEELINEVQLVLFERDGLLVRLQLWICRRAYRWMCALLLAILRYWGRR